MAQMTSGKVLRETRERKGYELDTVARRLRIRPDILRLAYGLHDLLRFRCCVNHIHCKCSCR